MEKKNCVKLLGINIDHKLSFLPHVEDICHKASQKTKALLRIRNYLTVSKARMLYDAYIMSAFAYCPLIWMFCGKSGNGLVNKTHHRALRAVYQEFELNLPKLLNKDDSVTVHISNLRSLMTEIYKSLNKLNPEFMWDYFQIKSTPYSHRNGQLLNIPAVRTKAYGINSLLFRGSILWNSVPINIKASCSVNIFKNRIKTWSGKLCNCTICTK